MHPGNRRRRHAAQEVILKPVDERRHRLRQPRLMAPHGSRQVTLRHGRRRRVQHRHQDVAVLAQPGFDGLDDAIGPRGMRTARGGDGASAGGVGGGCGGSGD